jgi:hypothetical protein
MSSVLIKSHGLQVTLYFTTYKKLPTHVFCAYKKAFTTMLWIKLEHRPGQVSTAVTPIQASAGLHVILIEGCQNFHSLMKEDIRRIS